MTFLSRPVFRLGTDSLTFPTAFKGGQWLKMSETLFDKNEFESNIPHGGASAADLNRTSQIHLLRI